MADLQSKVALVTGGGRGIGAGISRQLALRGARVAVNYSSGREAADKLAQRLRSQGLQAEIFQADVRESLEVNRMRDEIAKRWGTIEILVNNAIAGQNQGPFEEKSWEDYQTSIDFGLKAVWNTTHAVLDGMKRNKSGRIVNIVTELWNFAPAHWSVYLAGKGSMVGVSRGLADELGPHGITLNMVAPGWMLDDKHTQEDEGYAKGNPLRRQGTADDIGRAVAFLASDEAAFITGAYLPVCGGRVRQSG